jgi:hypothetical protein
MISSLEDLKVEYSISVPFKRFVELKEKIEKRNYWWPAWGTHGRSSYFKERWKPISCSRGVRFVFVRTQVKTQSKGPVQLDLFEPVERNFDYKVIVSNKTCLAGSIVHHNEGRGYQENIFAELKSQAQMDYIPALHRVANQVRFIFYAQ